MPRHTVTVNVLTNANGDKSLSRGLLSERLLLQNEVNQSVLFYPEEYLRKRQLGNREHRLFLFVTIT